MGKDFLKLSKEDITNMYKDMQENKDIQEIHVPINKVTFLDLIAKHYEDITVRCFHDYNNLEVKMSLEHRLRSISKEIEFIKGVVDNALVRIESNISPNKIHAIRLVTEKQNALQEN